MRVVGECFFWYRLTRVFPDKFHRAVKRLCVCVCVLGTNLICRENGLFHGGFMKIAQAYMWLLLLPVLTALFSGMLEIWRDMLLCSVRALSDIISYCLKASQH